VTIELTIESLAAGGDGVGRDDDGRVTFVPRSVPGDRVRVRIVEGKKRFARAAIEDVLNPSPDRVEARCGHFGADGCGGCHWQQVAVQAQRRAKADIVAGALRKAVGRGMELAELVAPVPDWNWRRRARWHWVKRSRGRIALGFFRQRSDRVVDLGECPQVVAELDEARQIVRDHAADHLFDRGTISAAVGTDGSVVLDIDGPCRAEGLAELVGRGPIAGVRAGGGVAGADSVELEPGLVVAAADFAQASSAGNQALLDLVDRETSPRDGLRILELFAGGGNLTRVLRRGAAEVVACELELPEHRTTGEREAGDAPVVWATGDVSAKLVELDAYEEEFDMIVLDPPRTGAAQALRGLAGLAPDRIVYVSCDPATLARDIETLAGAGYRAVRATPLDMMPQTAHVEVVATLERTQGAGGAS